MAHKVLIIAGMHRSGTSLISQWLYRCGLHIGTDFLGPQTGNAEGHFEDMDFYNLHEEILKAHALPGSGLTDQLLIEITSAELEKIRSLVAQKNNYSGDWGWKDPRTCLFLPVYSKLLPGANYLIIARDYKATVTSLVNRMYGLDEKKYASLDWFTNFLWETFRRHRRKKLLYKKYSSLFLKIWISYNEQILKQVSLLPVNSYIFVDYAALNKNDRQVFYHLHDYWGFNLTYVDFKTIYKKELMNDAVDFDHFIKDKALLLKANQIASALQHYAFKVTDAVMAQN